MIEIAAQLQSRGTVAGVSFDRSADDRFAAGGRLKALALPALALLLSAQHPAFAADESWNPFRRTDQASAIRKPETAASQAPDGTPDSRRGSGWNEPADRVERGYLPPPPPGVPIFSDDTTVRTQDLTPIVPASPGAGLAASADGSVWQGMSAESFTGHLSEMKLPIRSWSLRPMWLRLLTTEQPGADPAFAEARGEALFRAGALREALQTASRAGTSVSTRLLAARAQIALGEIEDGCAAIKNSATGTGEMPAPLRDMVILYAGYCAARSGQPSGAALAAELARNAGIDRPTTIAILERVGSGSLGGPPGADALSLLDVRLLQLLPGALTTFERNRLSRPAAVALAIDDSVSPAVRIMAAEVAAAAGAIGVDDLAAAYASVERMRLNDPDTDETRRGRLWLAIASERGIFQRTRDIRTFLDGAKQAGHYEAALRLCATILPQVKPVAEIGWFSETAIEISIAAGRLDFARDWIGFAVRQGGPNSGPLRHWGVLVDVADQLLPAEERGRNLDALERIALSGRMEPRDLHRITTVLDALNYNLPVPMWDYTNNTSQPTDGHLPPSGVLGQLAEASRAGPSARTILLTLQTLGESGPTGAHLLALSDSIRALKRAGLEADARRMAVEALFPLWPRTGEAG